MGLRGVQEAALVSKGSCLLQTHQLDCSAHYLRLKFLIENQIQLYVPKPEEEIYELVMQ